MIDSIEFIKNLVAIRSLSYQEQDAARYLVEVMQALNYDEAFVDAAGNAVGIRAFPDASGATARDIVLLGHMDTVPGDIPVRIEDGILHGRGSVDAKGPLATFVMAVASAEAKPGTRLIVVGAVEEECATSKGARHVATQYAPELCIIGEPSGWDAVTLGYKGRILIDYRLGRDMGHTAGQQSGVAESSIIWWNKISAYVEQFNADKPKLFDQMIPSIRDIQTSSDGITDSIYFKVGIRLPMNFDFDGFEALVREWAADADVNYYGHEKAWKSGRSTPLARAFSRSLLKTGVRKPRFKLKTGTSDMNVVGPVWQCPIVAYGPGDSKLDHTPQEHLILSEYQQAIDVLRSTLAQL